MGDADLPDNVYYQSYLKKAGIRFHYNVVDSTVKKGFGLSFYLCALIFIVLCLFGQSAAFTALLPLTVLLCAYLAYYAGRYFYFCRLRTRLRTQEPPILAQAYAVVLLDREYVMMPAALRQVKLRRAVIYKECGTAKPRFFLGAAQRRAQQCFMPGFTVRVFTDKRNPRYYSVDEDSAAVTQTARAPLLNALNLNGSLHTDARVQDSEQRRCG